MSTHRRRALPVLILALVAALLASFAAPANAQSKPVTLRLGYFANVTHGSAIVGVEKGYFKDALKAGGNKLSVRTFNSGNQAIQAVLAGAIDATYIGPSPAITGWAQSKAIKIISGAASGGALLVVNKDIADVDSLKGKRVATPGLGNTQDVALRYYLKTQSIKTDTNGGGQVSIVPQDNAQTLNAFRQGQIAGAWEPEPWASRMVLEGKGKVLLDERKLWPKGKFVTTHLIVTTKFLKDHPDAVKQLLQGQIKANGYLNSNPEGAKAAIDAGITRLTNQGISKQLLDAVWKNLDFTNDPIASSLQPNAEHAQAVGLLDKVDLKGIYDLSILNSLLKAAKQPTVSSAGL
ncbi:MAG: sulfonate transporter substrate-binding protein [Actinomycetia bacterium]|nr:sulfonate transporter substrate-binding protein [Actinomycetes bacterium]